MNFHIFIQGKGKQRERQVIDFIGSDYSTNCDQIANVLKTLHAWRFLFYNLHVIKPFSKQF